MVMLIIRRFDNHALWTDRYWNKCIQLEIVEILKSKSKKKETSKYVEARIYIA